MAARAWAMPTMHITWDITSACLSPLAHQLHPAGIIDEDILQLDVPSGVAMERTWAESK